MQRATLSGVEIYMLFFVLNNFFLSCWLCEIFKNLSEVINLSNYNALIRSSGNGRITVQCLIFAIAASYGDHFEKCTNKFFNMKNLFLGILLFDIYTLPGLFLLLYQQSSAVSMWSPLSSISVCYSWAEIKLCQTTRTIDLHCWYNTDLCRHFSSLYT